MSCSLYVFEFARKKALKMLSLRINNTGISLTSIAGKN